MAPKGTEPKEVLTLTVVQQPGSLSPSRVRLERIARKKFDMKNVLYEAKGPYEGIIINKHVKEIPARSSPHAVLDFVCYIVSKKDTSKRFKEHRAFSFWFGKDIPVRDQLKMANEFSKVILDPASFPQDVHLFIKKMMTMVHDRSYIRCVDLKVTKRRQIVQEAVVETTVTSEVHSAVMTEMTMDATMLEEDENVIRNYVTVLTPAQYDFQYVPEIPVSKKSFLNFRIKASANCHIALSAVYGSVEQKTYEIVLGARQNSRCYIKDNAEGAVVAEASTPNLLDPYDLKDFWVSWGGDQVQVGQGPVRYRNQIMVWNVPENRRHPVNCLAVATDNESTGQWEFVDMVYPSKNKDEIRAKARSSLLWLAKKQRLLNTLEDAYPECLTTEDMLRVSNIKSSDVMTAVVMLRDMQKKNLIKEMGKGKWMRMPGGQDHKQHEIRVVEDMPYLSRREQPTVAVITVLYCEKVAVDAVMDDKITYHKYSAKKEGDTSVYTIGRIGKTCVVSTKLARVGRGHFNTISAGNAVTRLLGTFNKVEHTVVVGVCGGVPNPNDVGKHVRPGDVIVSSVDRPDGDVYTLCDKIEFEGNGDRYKFVTKSWRLSDHFLQQIAAELRELQHRQTSGRYPWDEFLENAKEALHGEESSFYRPSGKADRRYQAVVNGQLMDFEHPIQAAGRKGLPTIHYGPFAAGKFVTRNDRLRHEFARQTNALAYDYELDAVLDSFVGNKLDSYVLIRGVADYQDGLKSKEWQPYASLAAAAYMKAFLLQLEGHL